MLTLLNVSTYPSILYLKGTIEIGTEESNYSSMTDRVINPSLQRFPALQPQVTLNQIPASNTKPNKSINWNNAAGLTNAGVGVFNAVNSSLGATNKTGNTLTSIGSAVGSLPIPGASIIGSGLGLIGGVANMFTNTVNKEHQRNIGKQISSLAGTTSNASSYEELQSDYNSLANANVELGDIDQWGSKGIFSSGSKRKRARRKAVEALETAKMQAGGLKKIPPDFVQFAGNFLGSFGDKGDKR